MTNLATFLNRVCPLSPALQEYLSEHIQTRNVQRSETLLAAGKVNQNIYFVRSGLLRRYYVERDIDVSSAFAMEGDIMYSPESFYKQISSRESIKPLEDSVVDYITHKDWDYLNRTFTEWIEVDRFLLQRDIVKSEEQAVLLRLSDASQRYEQVSRYYPNLRLRVPGKYLASFLGIAETSLSRIRNARK